jgi:hypothetical protein
MKKRFSDEQIISILHEAEAGVSTRNSAASMLFQTPLSTLGTRSLAAWKSLK